MISGIPSYARARRRVGDAGAPGWRAALLAVCGAGLLLCAVAAVDGSPLIWIDTRAYYMAGKLAIEKGFAILGSLIAEPSSLPPESHEVKNAVENVAAVRSPYYGAIIYVLDALHSLWLVAILQGLVVSYVVFLFCRLTVGNRVIPIFLATMAALTLLTTLPWYSAQIMPDVFAGVAIVCVALLGFYGDRMGRLEALALMAILSASVAFHNTHLLVATGLFVIVLLVKLVERRPLVELASTGGLLATPLALAVAAGLLVGYVGFNELTLTPQNPPFLLARSVADGPAKAYLQENCHALDYAICDYADRLPDDSEIFLWQKAGGVYVPASPEVRERLRAEEMAVIAAAVREYPLWQAAASLRNWLSQIGMFGITDVKLEGRATVDGDAGFVATWVDDGTAELLRVFSIVHYLVVALSLGVIGYYARQWAAGRDPGLRGVIIVGVAGLLLNAFVCGVLSIPTHRYQARVIWLLPLLAVPLVVAAARNRRQRHAAHLAPHIPGDYRPPQPADGHATIAAMIPPAVGRGVARGSTASSGGAAVGLDGPARRGYTRWRERPQAAAVSSGAGEWTEH